MRREYQGSAQSAVLTVALGGSTADLTIACDDLTNWPTGVSHPFYIAIDRGTVSEEKILCASRNGNTINVYNSGGVNGRGADGTSIAFHNANATVEHVFTATDADEANAHINNTTAVHGLTLNKVVITDSTQTLTNKSIVASINAQSTSYALVSSDAGKIVEMSNGGILTIPTNASVAFPVGTQVTVVQTGSSQVTIAGASGVTVNSAGSGLKIVSQWSAATLIKRSTDTWVAIGALVA